MLEIDGAGVSARRADMSMEVCAAALLQSRASKVARGRGRAGRKATVMAEIDHPGRRIRDARVVGVCVRS